MDAELRMMHCWIYIEHYAYELLFWVSTASCWGPFVKNNWWRASSADTLAPLKCQKASTLQTCQALFSFVLLGDLTCKKLIVHLSYLIVSLFKLCNLPLCICISRRLPYQSLSRHATSASLMWNELRCERSSQPHPCSETCWSCTTYYYFICDLYHMQNL